MRKIVLIALALVLAGCASPPSASEFVPPSVTAAPVEPTATQAPPSPTEEPTAPPPEPTPLPGGLTSQTNEHGTVSPVARHPGNWKFINPGAVFEVDGVWHMFANAFNEWPGESVVIHLYSSDGVNWEGDRNTPVLSITDDLAEYIINGAHIGSGYVTSVGTWVLYLYSLQNTSQPSRIGRATAPGPDGPWAVDPEPVLVPGPAGSWDEKEVQWPRMLETADGLVLYYHGTDKDGNGQIGMATSADGINWTKLPEPVLTPPAWAAGSVFRPAVAQTPERYVMVFTGVDWNERGIAFSEDGQTWTPYASNPILSADEVVRNTQNRWDAALIYNGNRLIYLLEIGAGATETNIYALYKQEPLLPWK